jgi:type I restriction enzyme M protein
MGSAIWIPRPCFRYSTSCARPDGRWRAYDYDELAKRDKVSLDIFWLRDESLSDSDNLPEPGVIAAEIVADLEAALEQFRLIAEDLGEPANDAQPAR